MKKIFAGAVAAAMVVAATGASALTYNWSFYATGGTSRGTVSGTISGLEIGSNDGSGLIVEVLSSPSGNVLGGGWSFVRTKNGGVSVVRVFGTKGCLI